MFTLYWHPKSASYAPHVVLEELGLPYRLRYVDMGSRAHKSPGYLRINPNGKVPTLLLPGGEAVFESAGMVLHLADLCVDSKLSVPPDDPRRVYLYQWLFYLTSDLYKVYGRTYSPQRFTTNPAHAEAIRAQALDALFVRWKPLDDALRDGPWLLGEQFTVCDLYMQMITLWHVPSSLLADATTQLPTDAFFSHFPNVARAAEATARRPAVKRIMPLYPSSGFAPTGPPPAAKRLLA